MNTLQVVSQTVLDAVTDALSDALRPVCKAYTSLGTPIILSCCECDDEGTNGEVSIHFRRMFDADATTLIEIQRVRPCRGGVTAASFRLVLARCSPILNSQGELPDPEEFSEAAEDQMLDAQLLWQSLATCGLALRIDDISVDLGEPGMCSVVFADITVAVTVPALFNPLSTP